MQTLQGYSSSTSAVPPPPLPARVRRPRPLEFAAFVAAGVWYFCALALAASAANGIAQRVGIWDGQALLDAGFRVLLVVLGLALLRAIERRRAPPALVLGVPRRTTAGAEWATGAAIGWGIAAASVLPMALARALNVHLWTSGRAFGVLGISLLALALTTLAKDMGLHGYAFQRLIDAIGPVRATLAMMMLAAAYAYVNPGLYEAPTSTRVLTAVLGTLLLSLCWLRTQALWVMWGLHFAWAASTAAVFGLAVGGNTSFSSVVETRAIGPVWLTGGSYGPAGAALSVLILLAALPVLVKATSDYAWAYTHAPLIPAGYDVTIPPPAAHAAMEQAAVSPAALVQILPLTPPGPAGPGE